MNVACFAALLLLAPVLLHVVVWRVRVPESQTLTLLMIFLAALPAGFLLNQFTPAGCPCRIHGFWEHAQVGLFHVAMSLAYVEFYTAIEQDSPTLTLLLFVKQAGAEGRTEQELFGLIDDEFVVGGRLRAMVKSGVVMLDDGVYRLSAVGRLWARLFQFGRHLHLRLGG